jgi:peptidoglycan-N-acetylglucosamine deacetylase
MRRWSLAVVFACTALVPAGCSPPPPTQEVWAGPITAAEVAITFDAHLDVANTPGILDALKSFSAPATFFVTGQWAEAHPDWLARMATEGHLVASHSYDHPDFTKLSDAAIVDQLVRTDAAITAITGHTPKPFMRLPFGARNARVNAILGAQGYRYSVMWTVDSGGWEGRRFDQVVQRVLDRTMPGAIIIFHESVPADREALPWILAALRDRGYRFVRLDTWFH